MNVIDELLCVGRVTHTLEELDTLFTLQLLKSAVLLDEVLLIHCQLHTLQVVQDALLSLLFGVNRGQTSQASCTGHFVEYGFGGRLVGEWGNVQLREAWMALHGHAWLRVTRRASNRSLRLLDCSASCCLPRAHLKESLGIRVSPARLILFVYLSSVKVGTGVVLCHIDLLWQSHRRSSISDDSDSFGLRVELTSLDLDLALGSRIGPWIVREVNAGRLRPGKSPQRGLI